MDSRLCCDACSEGAVLLSLSHANIHTAVHQRYIKPLGTDHESRLHRLIAGNLMLHNISLVDGQQFASSVSVAGVTIAKMYHLLCVKSYLINDCEHPPEQGQLFLQIAR